MARAPKPCGRWGCEELVVAATYCATHRRRPPSPSSRDAKRPGEARRRKAFVNAWVAEHGWICPGYERDAHPSRDLTAGHDVAVAFGGVELAIVLCRSCNSRQNSKPL